MMAAAKRTSWSRAAVAVVLILGSVLSLVPFFWMVRSSFMSMLEIYKVPPLLWSENTTWVNYRRFSWRTSPSLSTF